MVAVEQVYFDDKAVQTSSSILQDAGQGHLVEHLPKNIGFGMGLEFRESINLLKAGNERRVVAGMVFNVAVGVCISCVSQLVSRDLTCLMPRHQVASF